MRKFMSLLVLLKVLLVKYILFIVFRNRATEMKIKLKAIQAFQAH